MAKHANPTLVGGFVVGAVVLAVAGLMTFGAGDAFKEKVQLVAYFESSVSGLDVGAPIRFRGVQVGSVESIHAVWSQDENDIDIPVVLAFDSGRVHAPTQELADDLARRDPDEFFEAMIARGFRAQLEQDSFVTGKLYVGVDFHPEAPLRLVGGHDLPEIPTIETGLEKLMADIEDLHLPELVDSAVAAIQSIEDLIGDPRIGELIEHVDELVVSLNEAVPPLTESVVGTMDEARALLQSLDSETAAVSADLQKLLEGAEAQLDPLSESAMATLVDAREVLASLARIVGEDSGLQYRIAKLVDGLERAARTVRALADYLDRHPEAILSGKKR